jgi:hypothetical protein
MLLKNYIMKVVRRHIFICLYKDQMVNNSIEKTVFNNLLHGHILICVYKEHWSTMLLKGFLQRHILICLYIM